MKRKGKEKKKNNLERQFITPLNENMKVSPGAPFDDMSIDNTYLAEGNIRCTASLKEYHKWLLT